jgi:hypothetical protein
MNPMSKRSALSITALVSLVGLTAMSAGCSSSSDGDVAARLEIINKTSSALSTGAITSVTGTYSAACSGRAAGGTDGWTVDMVTPHNTNLSVRKNDSDCILTVRNIVTADGTFIGNPAIALDTSYQASGSAFAKAANPLAFYGNAKISASTFGADFTITLLVSDDASGTDAGTAPTAGFATQSGSVSNSSTVPAPAYLLTFGDMTVTKDADNVVDSTGGFAQLGTEGGVEGEDYAVVEGDMSGATYAAVHAAYTSAATKGTLASLENDQLPSSAFGLETADLDTPTYRTVIIRHKVSGVSSYQYFSVLFN